jgi:hypothetical protein
VETKADVCEILNIMTESLNDKYLGLLALIGVDRGLLALIGVDRSDCFRHLIDRVRARISRWNEKLLSVVGKEVSGTDIMVPTEGGLVVINNRFVQTIKGCDRGFIRP